MNSGHRNDHLITRRQFNWSAILMASVGLIGQPLALIASSKSNPDLASLRNILNKRTSFYSRSSWARQSPIYARLAPAAPYYRITIHHEGNDTNYDRSSSAVIRDLQQVLAAHRRKGYGDIGYHFMIDYSGRIWEGRSLKYQGAHVSSRNPGNIGIVLLGNFEIQKPAVAQKDALVKLVAELRSYYGIGRRRIYGHRDLDSTLCPGRNLYAFLPTLKASTG
ncbi:MAG: peptidoglycan recognition protein family protein [Verrucomicrobia bacterium]|nr:peptidoglycan recognition protein family protein [Verrucomicrobiota bacterium]MBU4290754.1 peptidoglycan recognition protein family protein [Verrucomicrobiota bacterium]MBU4429452.1 peptidoglycan recognition protein family protein [Verrucomicrobiota bacterium]MCG2679772.1 peptidoglycan recognition protein family protein [Kiritimatiellia bacterium]